MKYPVGLYVPILVNLPRIICFQNKDGKKAFKPREKKKANGGDY